MLLWPLLLALTAGDARSLLTVDPEVVCPSREAIATELNHAAGAGGNTLSVHRGAGGTLLIVEWLNPAGERLASRTIDSNFTRCDELVRTIALLAEAWAQRFPASSVPAPAPSPRFHPGPLSARLSGVGALDFTSSPLSAVPGAGGELAVELGVGDRYSVGASAAWLSNARITVTVPDAEGSISRPSSTRGCSPPSLTISP